MEEKTLLPLERYLKTGSHIGTRFKTGDMQRYIFKARKDGLKVLDVETIDKRIRITAEFLNNYELPKIIVVSRKTYGHAAVKKFAEATGAKFLTGRFMPGTFTNPKARSFTECDAIIITDPEYDKQAIEEAVKKRIPVIALCSTNNYLENIDLIIPINNKGRKSLALAFWLLARELLKLKGHIKKDEEFTMQAEEFEYQLKAGEEERPLEEKPRQTKGRGKKQFEKRPFRRRTSERRSEDSY
jgi:small subunit ribosomal protein S2